MEKRREKAREIAGKWHQKKFLSPIHRFEAFAQEFP